MTRSAPFSRLALLMAALTPLAQAAAQVSSGRARPQADAATAPRASASAASECNDSQVAVRSLQTPMGLDLQFAGATRDSADVNCARAAAQEQAAPPEGSGATRIDVRLEFTGAGATVHFVIRDPALRRRVVESFRSELQAPVSPPDPASENRSPRVAARPSAAPARRPAEPSDSIPRDSLASPSREARPRRRAAPGWPTFPGWPGARRGAPRPASPTSARP